jgi:hypothetical protein
MNLWNEVWVVLNEVNQVVGDLFLILKGNQDVEVLLPAAVAAAVAALKGLEHSICDKFAMDSAAQAKTDAEKHCLVSCNYSRCIGKTSGFLQGAVQSFIGGIIHEIIQTGSVGNTWQGAIADIRSNLVGIVGGLNPFSDCKSICDPCKGKWNP